MSIAHVNIGVNLYGHDWAVDLLNRALLSTDDRSHDDRGHDGLSHAYLFLGPRHLGKTTLAKRFAQTLLCHDAVTKPCGVCRACQLLERGHHPDFYMIQPTNKDGEVDRDGGTLRVDQAATILRETQLRPMESRYKFFLIQDFHAANDSFANKLLKTLEEPPEHVILCLLALDRQSVLPTIVSRCQILELRPIPINVITQSLIDHWQIEPEMALLVARLSNGRLGWAVERAADEDAWQARLDQLETLWRLVEADRVQRLNYATELGSSRDNRRLFGMIELWATWWRDVLLAQCDCMDGCSNVDQLAKITYHAEKISSESVQRYLQTLKRIEGYLHHTVNLRMALDVLLLQIPRPVSH